MTAHDNPPPQPPAPDSSAKTAIDSNAKTMLGGDKPVPPPEGRPNVTALAGGVLLGGRYELLAPLGQGGMGAVYKARDRELDEEVAVKVLLPEIVDAPGMAERFLIEAKTSLQLTHPGIVRVRSFESDKALGLKYIVMALVRGRSLRALINEKKRLDPPEGTRIVRQVLDALAVAHEITVHRDLKPENIMLTEAGKPVILDFGLAKSMPTADGRQLTQSGAVMGTYAYMAPEQRIDTASVDVRADIYAMGAVLYECWTGFAPAGSFPAATLIRPELPPEADEIVRRSLALRPEDRFPTARAMIEALDALHLPKPAPRAGGMPKAAWAAVALAMALAGVLIVAKMRGAPPAAPPGAPPAVAAAPGPAAAPPAPAPAPVPAPAPAPAPPPAAPVPDRPALPPGTALPARYEPPAGPAPTDPHEAAWRAFLAEKRPFKAFPSDALVKAMPALKGELVLIEGISQDVHWTDRKEVEHTLKEAEDGQIFARWWMPLLRKETWWEIETRRYSHQNQAVVGPLVDVVRRDRGGEVVEVPIIEARWKRVKDGPAYVPSAGGDDVTVSGEKEYMEKLAKHFTEVRLPADPKPKRILHVALVAVKEGNRPLWDQLWSDAESSARTREQSWIELRRMFHFTRGEPDERERRSLLEDWQIGRADTFTNFRGEREAEIEVAYSNQAGQPGYRNETFELVEEGGRWKLGSHDLWRYRPKSNAAAPAADATPQAVWAAFLRCVMENDKEAARALAVEDGYPDSWLHNWQIKLREGMVEAPVVDTKIEGDAATLRIAPRNKKPSKEMEQYEVSLKKVDGVWKMASAY